MTLRELIEKANGTESFMLDRDVVLVVDMEEYIVDSLEFNGSVELSLRGARLGDCSDCNFEYDHRLTEDAKKCLEKAECRLKKAKKQMKKMKAFFHRIEED